MLYPAGNGKESRSAVTNGATFTGVIRRDPGQSKPLVMVAFSCVLNAARSFEGGANPLLLPGEKFTGRYTRENLYFPHTALTRNASQHKADLLVFSGDQIYEGNLTALDRRPQFDELDFLYKWYLWLWAFRDLTRSVPTIVQVDDHDVFQGNIWGMGGKRAAEETGREGGYGRSPAWVNLAQRTQCGHNPDSYDATPIEQGISVYYGQFHLRTRLRPQSRAPVVSTGKCLV